MIRQRTIKREISCSGIGLHSGQKVELTLRPAPAGSGIVFKRVDLNDLAIPLKTEYIADSWHATSILKGKVQIATVEHLLAALYALSVDNIIVELNSSEVPIMDGSAAPFIWLLHQAGFRRLPAARRFILVKKPIRVDEKGRSVAVYPAESFKISYLIEFDHPLVKRQFLSLIIAPKPFIEEIAPSRTFGFLREVELLRRNGLARGGSLDNAVIIGDDSILNQKLRFPDEFVRHKILDAIGDLSFLGAPILGHTVAFRAGHSLHLRLVQKILRERGSWEKVTLPLPSSHPLRVKPFPSEVPSAE
jgi:UDP-3-O-[3-hydroxymyristoyl] N-acetylglucosamine deacetylase